jgi:hypothetical protein
MATDSIEKGIVASGGAKVATESLTEDAVTKHIQRIAIDGRNGKSVTSADGAAASTPDGTVNVTTSSTPVLAANTSRVGFTINNTGGAIIYLRLAGTSATVAAGIRLTPGAFWGMQGPGIYRGAICAITSSGTADVRLCEW